jgi:hypothetical protein
VVVAVAATGLGADREAIGQALEDPPHRVEGADLGAAGDRPGLAEHADREALVVEIEPDGEPGCLLKSLDLGNAATEFQVTRLTGASFIVSTPRSIRPTRPSRLSGDLMADRVASRSATFRGSRSLSVSG